MGSQTKEIFIAKGIVKGKETKALTIFAELVPDFTQLKSMDASVYVKTLWDRYGQHFHEDNSINGKIFEYIIISLLLNKNIVPLYIQAKVAFVPNVDFDLLLYSGVKPIALSIKTSLRERYKQADLEAIALKYVHRKAECYLVTMNEGESKKINEKIQMGDVIGLDRSYYAGAASFDTLIAHLLSLPLHKAGSVEIVTASSVVE